METKKNKKANIKYITFKSYYVVWKPTRRMTSQECFGQFKSYYVVWKRDEACKGCAYSYYKFKSYYVVWKPTRRMTSQECFGRLNRTM